MAASSQEQEQEQEQEQRWVNFSSNVGDEGKKNELIDQLNGLLGNGWVLDENRVGVKKTFYFKTYTKALV